MKNNIRKLKQLQTHTNSGDTAIGQGRTPLCIIKQENCTGPEEEGYIHNLYCLGRRPEVACVLSLLLGPLVVQVSNDRFHETKSHISD